MTTRPRTTRPAPSRPRQQRGAAAAGGPAYGVARRRSRPDEEKMWAIGAHLGPLLLGFVAPLVVWLVYKDRSPWLDRQGGRRSTSSSRC